MNGWYGNVFDKAPTLSISIRIAGTKNMRFYCGQQRGTSKPVSCESPFKGSDVLLPFCVWMKMGFV